MVNMCNKNPSNCQATIECECCTASEHKHYSMSEIRKAYLEAKDKGQVKSYKISVDLPEEHDKIVLDVQEVDKIQTEKDHIVVVK